MSGRRSPVQPQRRVGINKNHSTGSPLSQFNGKGGKNGKNGSNIRTPKLRRVDSTSVNMKRDIDPSDEDVSAPPKSSDDEAEDVPLQEPGMGNDDGDDSDEEYNRRKRADIRGTTFDNKTSKPRTREMHREQSHKSKSDDRFSLAGSKRATEAHGPEERNELEREIEAPSERKKRPSKMARYGEQSKPKRPSSSQPRFSVAKDIQQDDAESTSSRSSFHRPPTISPMKSQSPRKVFKTQRQLSDLNEPEQPKPIFKDLSRRGLTPFATPKKRRMSPVDDKTTESKDRKAANPSTKGLGGSIQRRNSKRNKLQPNPTPEAASQRPVFKMPGLDDDDLFDDTGSLGATTVPGESQDTWDHLEMEETEATTTPRCPMCHQEVDRELLEKYSTQGKMSVKQQTTFCRAHKRKSAAKLGSEKGYPKIDWETLDSRLSSHRKFLQNILEGTQASHYRSILKERVDSGKNRTLLKSDDNLTPGYYGPKGLQVMTQFIMRTLSDVLRRRAVEDKLISARSYTGYVQTVLVPELTVQLIMEDMSIGERRARDVLEESVEIGELLHEEDRDVVMMNEIEEDMAPEI